MNILAGDIGATKTLLALYRPDDPLTSPIVSEILYNSDADGPVSLIEQFLHGCHIAPDAACIGVAGPVRNNRVRMTNLNWDLDGAALRERFNLQDFLLINDLVATAAGAVILPRENLFIINRGSPDPEGTIGIIAPGTGLGESLLVQQGNLHLPLPSEGGHSGFAPNGDQQRRLLDFMSANHTRVSIEMVCSGRGIPSLFAFLRAEQSASAPPAGEAGTRAIIDAAMAAHTGNEHTSTALQAMQLFVKILAGEAANLALKAMTTGGLYIGGGIPPRILPLFAQETFMTAFADGPHADMLAAVPIHGILEPRTALFGAASFGRKNCKGAPRKK